MLEQNNSTIAIAQEDIVSKIATEYLALSPTQRAKTLIVSGTNDKRRKITAAILEGLRSIGFIGPDLPARQLVDYKFTKVENSYARNYNVGDIIVPIRNYKQLVKGQSYVVADQEADNIVLRSPEGERLVTDLNFEKAHHREESLGVAVGDRLRWSKNDTQLQRRNGQEFEIESTIDRVANIKYRDGRTEAIDLRQAHHFDLAIATTIYSSQGKTSDRVFVAADRMQNSESFYVAASQAKSELKIFTDSPANLRSMVMDSMSNRNPRELLSDLYRRQAILKAQKQHGVSDRNVLQVEFEPLLDRVNEREDLDEQEGVKVPTHGGGVKVPTHQGDVGTLTSRDYELDTTPVL